MDQRADPFGFAKGVLNDLSANRIGQSMSVLFLMKIANIKQQRGHRAVQFVRHGGADLARHPRTGRGELPYLGVVRQLSVGVGSCRSLNAASFSIRVKTPILALDTAIVGSTQWSGSIARVETACECTMRRRAACRQTEIIHMVGRTAKLKARHGDDRNRRIPPDVFDGVEAVYAGMKISSITTSKTDCWSARMPA